MDRMSSAITDTSTSFLNKDTVFKFVSVLFGLAALGFFGFSFYSLSKFLGNSDTNNAIQDVISPYIWGPAAASIALFLFAITFFYQDKTYLIFFMLLLLCLNTIMAYSALTISAWQKKM